MNGILKKDVTIRIVSILCAIILWYNVLDKNTNPVQTISLSVPLKVINEEVLKDRGMGLKTRDFPRFVLINIKGRKDKIKNITVNDFEAQVDIANVDNISEKELPIDIIKHREDVTVEGMNPGITKLDLEYLSQSSFNVEIRTTGNLKKNYKIVNTSVSPDMVSLDGLGSIIKSISSVKAFIDVSNLDKNLNIKKECKIYDSQGGEIKGLNKNIIVDVNLSVAKEVPIIPAVKGNPAKNYIDVENKVNPQTALISGPPNLLASINELQVEPVDIENRSSNANIKSKLKLPEGITLVNTPNEVTVNVSIEQVGRKDYLIEKDAIDLLNKEIDNSLNYIIQTESITISLKGKIEVLNHLKIEDLKPSMDVAGLSEGAYKLPLKLTLPENVKTVENYEADILIEKR